MVDLLGAGARWLERQRIAYLTRSVVYRRQISGTTVVIPLLATVGKTTFEVVSAGGVVERVESRDYLISLTALGPLGIPLRGDRIIEDIGSTRHTAEVSAPGREAHWRWSDPNRLCYRIHTKHLTTEVIP